jgi:hypothetical protein
MLAAIIAVMVYQMIWPIYYASWGLPYVTGQQSRHEYLTQSLDVYPIADYANRNLPATARIAAVWEERGYYFSRPLIIGQSPDGAFMHQFLTGDDPAELAAAFRSRGITHLIINDKLVDDFEFKLRDRYIYGIETTSRLVYDPSFRACYLQPVFEYQDIILYQLLATPTCPGK